MIIKKVFLSILICALVALVSLNAIAAEENPLAKFSKIFPEKVGEFHKTRADIISKPKSESNQNTFAGFNRYYEFKSGAGVFVTIQRTDSEDSAYSILTFNLKKAPSDTVLQKCEIGTVCFKWERAISFINGTDVVFIDYTDARMTAPQNEKLPNLESAFLTLGKLISDNTDKAEGDVPPALVQHLPDWEKVQSKAIYARSVESLKSVWEKASVPPVIEVIPVIEGTEAVVANYDKSKLIIVEYPTPQFATDGDQRITQKINELKSQNQSVPSAYKRVGNYSVFVFDAPDEATANNLIKQVDYGKTVQWLNGDPYEYDRANRRYLLAAGGIIVTVLKTAGIALLLCIVVGGSFGYFIFMRRRKEQAMSTAFSDAGGMLRLNLDEMTPQTDPSRLLEK